MRKEILILFNLTAALMTMGWPVTEIRVQVKKSFNTSMLKNKETRSLNVVKRC